MDRIFFQISRMAQATQDFSYNFQVRLPLSEETEEDIKVRNEEIASKYPVDEEQLGIWMLYFDRAEINDMWIKAYKLYITNELEGIVSMITSTAVNASRATNPERSGVIRFQCGPSDDEARMLNYGFKLVQKMGYISAAGFVAFKTDQQSNLGTAATGQPKNYTYRLIVPTRDTFLR